MSGTVVVQKYGGSSVADVEQIRAVARRVVAGVQAGHRLVVVVSAMGNTTSELLELARSVSPDPGRRELDLLVSVGERVSMTLLAMAIQDLGVPAASFTGSQSGIITDENHVAAQVIEVRPHRIQRALDEGKVAIVAGFQGVSRTGEVTTLGRGGSDTTAVVIAAALGAEHCEICTDVDGIHTADPRVVPEAARIDTLPLDAAVALSQAGSRVLLSDAVARAQAMGVQLQAAATHRPPGTGTRLPPGPVPDAIVAVAADTELCWGRVARAEDIGSLSGAPRAWWQGSNGVEVVVDTRNLSAEGLDGARAVTAISAVGRRAVSDPNCVSAAVAALEPLGLLHWWAGGATWTGLIPGESAAAGEAAIHRALLGSG